MSIFDDLPEPEEPEGPPDEWDEASKAVIASRGGHGAILWFRGSAIEHELDAVGGDLSDMGLDDAPDGISIWEGTYVTIRGGGEYDGDYDSEPSGKFRTPTDEEWVAIRENRSPWASTPPPATSELPSDAGDQLDTQGSGKTP